MDNLTHSLVGALIGQAGLKRRTGLAMPALIIGANIPDIDAGCVVFGMESLAMRRGLTHGPIAWVLLPLVLAALLWGFDQWQEKRGKRSEGRLPVHFGWLFALSFIACLTHPALDWLNNYGVRLLEPFSHRWFYGDVLFIIDLWLWLGLGFATWLSLRRERRGGNWRAPARIALGAALAYIGMNWAISEHHKTEYGNALVGDAIIIPNPVPVLFWQREGLIGRTNDWYVSTEAYPGGPVSAPQEVGARGRRCAWPDTDTLSAARPDLAAFLFWSRAPFVERHPNGAGMVFRDARFAMRGIGEDRFSVALPSETCRAVAVE